MNWYRHIQLFIEHLKCQVCQLVLLFVLLSLFVYSQLRLCCLFNFVYLAVGYADTSRTREVYEDERLNATHQNRLCVTQADRSLTSKGSHASQGHNFVTHSGGLPKKIYAQVSSDLEYLSSVPSESTKSRKLSLEVQQVYSELQAISNKLKVLYC